MLFCFVANFTKISTSLRAFHWAALNLFAPFKVWRDCTFKPWPCSDQYAHRCWVCCAGSGCPSLMLIGSIVKHFPLDECFRVTIMYRIVGKRLKWPLGENCSVSILSRERFCFISSVMDSEQRTPWFWIWRRLNKHTPFFRCLQHWLFSPHPPSLVSSLIGQTRMNNVKNLQSLLKKKISHF